MILIQEAIPCEIFSGRPIRELVGVTIDTPGKHYNFRIPNGVPMKLLQEEIVIRIRTTEILITVEPAELEEE